MDDYEHILRESSEFVARRLLGALLRRTQDDGRKIVVRIVETESYHPTDPASHSYAGVTKRTSIMYGPPGLAYVYFIYGMYYCLNVVTGEVGDGSAVLIRSVEPLTAGSPELATNGPGKLCRALDIDLKLNGHDLRQAPLELLIQPELPPNQIILSPRIGITKAKDTLARFYIRDNPFVSKIEKS